MDDSNRLREGLEDEDMAFGSLNLLTKSLHNLDERGLVLSLAAFAEDALGLLLKAFMLPTDATHQLLEGFNAPLGTFSSRIKAAYSLGLIAKDQFEDLEHLRKIRNEFAHSWRTISLENSKIAAHVNAINYSSIDDNFPETPLEKMRTSISSLLVELRSAAHQIEKKGARTQVTGSRLLALFSGEFNQQIEAARSQLAAIDENLKTAVGEKRTFFKMLLKRLEMKLYLVSGAAPKERRPEVVALLDDVKRMVVE